MASKAPALVWFRDDLRLSDQPALNAARDVGGSVLCVYLFDEESEGLRRLGGASRWWLHHALAALARDLERIGGRLDILRGRAGDIVPALARASGAAHVFWTHRYGQAERVVDERVEAALRDEGIDARGFTGQLLFEAGAIRPKSGKFFKVYTPFWRACLSLPEPRTPLPAPRKLEAAAWPKGGGRRIKLESLDLLPTKPDWAGGLRRTWTPGEAAARKRLKTFLDEGLADYIKGRDLPGELGSSGLSPHLRFGEISPRTIFHATRHAADADHQLAQAAEKFLSELRWREFNTNLLVHTPQLATKSFQPRFDGFKWEKPPAEALRRWRQGQTGYPIVDAGMRELWQTGAMHNRVRMITASFLIKHLLVDWRIGEQWFWDTLCDADPANNPANWQWVAGSGADAAPYFRIFNPTAQGEKFDPDGAYVRRYVPELAKLPSKWIHRPWAAPTDVLATAGVRLGREYPQPMVDHGEARARALKAYAQLPRGQPQPGG
jgi:deoxyribodipyrimidine photo-lyase